MKIVILDAYCVNPGDLSWDELRRFGEVEVYDRTEYDDAVIAERIGDAEIVITNKTPISKAVLDVCWNIKFIAVLATGYNIVDIACASEKGIPVSNHTGLRNGGCRTVCVRAAAGDMPSYCAPFRGRPRGPLGDRPRLVFLGLSSHRARRQDHGRARLRPHRQADRAHRKSNGDESLGKQPLEAVGRG